VGETGFDTTCDAIW